jgi:hypothetical protein
MPLRKIAQINHFPILIFIPLLLFLAFLTVMSSSLFLSVVGSVSGMKEPFMQARPSAQEIMVESVCGINDNGRKQVLDIIGVALPYLILIFMAGLLITVTTESGNRFLYIIRQKTYGRWLMQSLCKVLLWLLSMWTLYYAAIIVFSVLLSENTKGLGEIFYYLNTTANPGVSVERVMLLQYAIGCLTCLLIASSQFMFSIVLRDASKAYICLSICLLFCVFLGMFDIYNPLMMSKHGELNNQIGISPLWTLTLLLIVSLICTFVSKHYLRRKGL